MYACNDATTVVAKDEGGNGNVRCDIFIVSGDDDVDCDEICGMFET